MRLLVVAALTCLFVLIAAPVSAQPVGDCPPGDWVMLEEGVDYLVFIEEPSNQPPWVSGEPVPVHQWRDRNDDGFVCRLDAEGISALADNNKPLP